MKESVSEVARLRQQIAEEIESMRRGFKDFAAGITRHEFIRARMEQIGDHQEALAMHVGPSAAASTVCKLYIDIVR
ncbi:MAG TPA: hypothetical protein VKX46_02695 [Ktedonobacteraceae bacterium]|nr:hypothetical protein [Ktedonobacteraceae bacterium]